MFLLSSLPQLSENFYVSLPNQHCVLNALSKYKAKRVDKQTYKTQKSKIDKPKK